jgi:predicted nucleic acid-binding protein
MSRFFVDTFYLIALSNRRDQWHRRVVTFSRALRDVRLYTVLPLPVIMPCRAVPRP